MKVLTFLAVLFFTGSASAVEYFPVRSTNYTTNGTTRITATIDTSSVNLVRLVGSTTMWIVFTSKEGSANATAPSEGGDGSILLPGLEVERFRVSTSTVLLILSDSAGIINITDLSQ